MNDEQEPKGNPLLRNMAIWSGIIVALLLVASIFSGSAPKPPRVSVIRLSVKRLTQAK